jgi:hypothetical protein
MAPVPVNTNTKVPRNSAINLCCWDENITESPFKSGREEVQNQEKDILSNPLLEGEFILPY